MPHRKKTKKTSFFTPCWMATHDHFLLDLDGTLIHQNSAADGAAELLSRLEERYALVSNNSTDIAPQLSRKLRLMGLSVPSERIVLAGQYTVDWVRRHHPGARVLLIGSPSLQRYALQQGCHLVEKEPEIVLLALDKRFSYPKLSQTANAIRDGAGLIVTNADLSHPTATGSVVPETGTLMHAITACASQSPMAILGKPGEGLFLEGLQRLRSRPDNTLFIGDNPSTDAAGAIRVGMRYLLVGRHALADAISPAQLLDCDVNGHTCLQRLGNKEDTCIFPVAPDCGKQTARPIITQPGSADREHRLSNV